MAQVIYTRAAVHDHISRSLAKGIQAQADSSMKIVEIDSSSNKKLKSIRSLANSTKTRHESSKLILIEGHKLIEEALRHDIELQDIVMSREYLESGFDASGLGEKLSTIHVVKEHFFKGLYTTDTSCGIVASATPKHFDISSIISTSRTLLIAADIQDPGNLGTIIRTAYAFTAGGIILSKGTVNCYNTKVIRSSMGAIFALPVLLGMDLKIIIEELRSAGVHIVALEGKAEKTVWEEPIREPSAYILGNEGHGIASDVLYLADSRVSIPINPQCESLNVAVAAAIVLVRDKIGKRSDNSSRYQK